jgi:hypothetical protein
MDRHIFGEGPTLDGNKYMPISSFMRNGLLNLPSVCFTISFQCFSFFALQIVSTYMDE